MRIFRKKLMIMKKVFLALSLMLFVGTVGTTVYAASSDVNTEITKKDDDKKKKKKKKACTGEKAACSTTEKAACSSKTTATEGKSCCAKKN